jgi:uncharacterized protein DUF4382
VLIIILVLTLTPSITKGTLNVRVYAQIPQGAVKHLYATFTNVQLHAAGLPQTSGWININQNTIGPNIDLVTAPNQLIPGRVLSSSVTSGKYDSIRISFSNSTIILTGGHKSTIPTGPQLSADSTISIPPNGNGDILFILSLDYSQLISTSPSISATISQVTAS